MELACGIGISYIYICICMKWLQYTGTYVEILRVAKMGSRKIRLDLQIVISR